MGRYGLGFKEYVEEMNIEEKSELEEMVVKKVQEMKFKGEIEEMEVIMLLPPNRNCHSCKNRSLPQLQHY